jgi:hypothetical protein
MTGKVEAHGERIFARVDDNLAVGRSFGFFSGTSVLKNLLDKEKLHPTFLYVGERDLV